MPERIALSARTARSRNDSRIRGESALSLPTRTEREEASLLHLREKAELLDAGEQLRSAASGRLRTEARALEAGIHLNALRLRCERRCSARHCAMQRPLPAAGKRTVAHLDAQAAAAAGLGDRRLGDKGRGNEGGVHVGVRREWIARALGDSGTLLVCFAVGRCTFPNPKCVKPSLHRSQRCARLVARRV